MMPEIYFIAPHPLAFTSGGNRYNSQLIGALRLAGWKVRRFGLFDPRIRKIPSGSLIVVDSIYRNALMEGNFELPPHSKWAGLIHYLPELDGEREGANESWASVFDLLLFPSDYLLKRFRSFFTSSSTPSFILPPIIPVRTWPVAALNSGGDPHLMIVANYLPVKGILELLQELATSFDQPAPLPGFRLSVYGSILDEAYWRACRDAVDSSPTLRHRTALNKDMPHFKLFAALSEASAVVSASAFESFGMAIAEAMALKRPVFALSRGNIPELVSGYPAARLFERIEELAACLDEAVRDPAIIEDLCQKAQTVPFDHRPFSSEHVVRQWEWIMDHFW